MNLTIVMYHYVRELPLTRYPRIKGLLFSDFKNQIRHFQQFYHFVTMEECVAAQAGHGTIPRNSILLTFDDGYIDHYHHVFPFLQEQGIQGSFFVPARPVEENEVLDVNKIHFVLAVANTHELVGEIRALLNHHRAEWEVPSFEELYTRLAQPSRFDTADVVFVKRLLQVELPEELRGIITSALFARYVAEDEAAFARELYLDIDQIKCMGRSGMYIGSHGYRHYWLDRLSPDQQNEEITQSLRFLDSIGAPTRDWVMCYPYGASNASLIELLPPKRCALGLSTRVDIADLTADGDGRYTLPRLDTNDFPREADAAPTDWTQRVRAS